MCRFRCGDDADREAGKVDALGSGLAVPQIADRAAVGRQRKSQLAPLDRAVEDLATRSKSMPIFRGFRSLGSTEKVCANLSTRRASAARFLDLLMAALHMRAEVL